MTGRNYNQWLLAINSFSIFAFQSTKKTFLYLLIFVYLILQFYAYPFSSLDYGGFGALNALVVIICRLTLPVLFAWIIYNYYGFDVQRLLEEIGLSSFSGTRIDRPKQWQNKRFTGELEMVAGLNGGKPEEAHRLMKDKQTNGDSQFNEKLNEKRRNEQNSRSFDKPIDKLLIEMQAGLAQDGPPSIKLDELIFFANQNCYSNHVELIGFNSISRMAKKNGDLYGHQKPIFNRAEKFQVPRSFTSLLIIYSRLTRSLYLSHHFYLTYDLYTVRSPLATDLYHIVARLAYHLFFSHLVAILFHLLIERPLNSSTKLICERLLKSFGG